MFLRHLRRTRLLLHVVDAATADPATDYLAVRQELRMYNPTYVTRPHVVALNKIDLEDAGVSCVC
jgi:GTPase involved in cell partitioning and DNA repair